MLLKTRAKVLAMENAARLGGVKVFRGVTSARRLFEYPALELPLLSVSVFTLQQIDHASGGVHRLVADQGARWRLRRTRPRWSDE